MIDLIIAMRGEWEYYLQKIGPALQAARPAYLTVALDAEGKPTRRLVSIDHDPAKVKRTIDGIPVIVFDNATDAQARVAKECLAGKNVGQFGWTGDEEARIPGGTVYRPRL